jgi:type I restriction enzyme S subunit
VINKQQIGYLCGTGSLFVRFKEQVNSIFIMYVIRSQSFANALIAAAKGATMLNINSNTVENLIFILPPIALQQEFAAKVGAIESAKAELNAQIVEMQNLLASRMDYYFD